MEGSDKVLALQAMIEQMTLPKHNSRCGTNKCAACNWKSIADEIEWPSWRADVGEPRHAAE